MFAFENTKKQGDAGLGAAIAYFTRQGVTVLLPLTDSQDYDLVIDGNNGLERVQCRTTTQQAPSGNYVVGLRTLGGNQSWSGVSKYIDRTRVSWLFVLASDGTTWLVNTQAFAANAQLTLRDEWKL